MNLAKLVGWDWIISVGIGLLFGWGVGMRTDFVLGCAAFTITQYTFMNFVYLTRLERHLRELVLVSRLKFDVEQLQKAVAVMKQEVEQHDERRP